MDLVWKYKIDLIDEKILERIESKRHFKFPQDLKEFIIKNNAATPTKNKYLVDKQERIFGAVLSFNENDKEADNFDDAIFSIEDNNLIPFVVDPFGNFLCYRIIENDIVFWNHENGQISEVCKSVIDLISSLY